MAPASWWIRNAEQSSALPGPPQPRVRPDVPATPPAGVWTPAPFQAHPPVPTQASSHEAAANSAHDLAAMFTGGSPLDFANHADKIHNAYRWSWE